MHPKKHMKNVPSMQRVKELIDASAIASEKVSEYDQDHNPTPQTNPPHREKESQNIYSNKTSVKQ